MAGIKLKSKMGTVIVTLALLASSFFSTGFTFVSGLREAPSYRITLPPFDYQLTDVQGHWAEAAIMEMYARGIMNGYRDGSFRPRQSVTMLEAIVLMDKLLGYEPSAEDVAANAYLEKNYNVPRWAIGYVALAMKNDLLLYNEMSNMSRQVPLIRQETAVLAVRTAGLLKQVRKRKAVQLGYYDTEKIPSNLQAYIEVVGEQDIMKGYSDGSFRPDDPVSRGEMAIILRNIYENIPTKKANQISGFIKKISGNIIVLNDLSERQTEMVLPENHMTYLNDRPSSVSQLAVGDFLTSITRPGGAVLLVAKSVIPDDGIHLGFDQVNLALAPQEIKQWAEGNLSAENCLVKVYNDTLFILAARGEKMTAGYSVDIMKISRIKDDGDDKELTYNVTVELGDPASDTLVNQVISYPYALVSLPLPREALTVKFVDEYNQILTEILIKNKFSSIPQ